MKVTVLGCGAAPGVPSISNGWGRCDPENPRNRRRRASILVEEGPTTILVDTSPDLRAQLLDTGTQRLDAVLFTHSHADHIHGLDELREINRVMRGPIAAYAAADTLADLEGRFGYAFEGIPPGQSFFRPWLLANLIAPGQTFSVGDVSIRAFAQNHGYSTTIGFRFGDLVYSTDLIDLPADAKTTVQGAKLWIVGALQTAPHPTHAHIAKVLEWITELRPARAVITHMSNDLDYEAVSVQLPAGVMAGYDGMAIEI